MAEAIVKQAKKDFIKHPKDTIHHESSKHFVMSEWFKTITLGAADSKKTLDSWEDEKYVYDMWKEVKFKTMFKQEEAKTIGKMFRDKIHTNNIMLWNYLSYLNAEGYLVGSKWDDIEKHADLLKHYGWEYITDSADRCQAFKPVKTNKGYYITMKMPLYLTHTEPKKEVE